MWGNGEKIGGIPGVGPWAVEHPDLPVPTESHFDPELLANGDRRNVVDKYRYWTVQAIHDDLAQQRCALHVAIENLAHDLNIGSIVRTGNAFNVGGVHIVGRRRWNRRGALVTDRYLDMFHHPDADELAGWAAEHDYVLVAVDNTGNTEPIEMAALPERCVLVFGQESTGISQELRAVCPMAVYIPQYGSTRSLNVAAAAAIAQHMWVLQHRR
ncbi:TrmH family RNA methyltransferase [Trueperella sp. LYQ141]|uniref:TrmH family RNA methyltransferase n=1 Tax=Trueperella sp. LYQ141 TaxID=3391058 RepID=UPI0039835293